ncbi:MAG TPA: hypothetical protein VKV37_03115 [Ktedonobacteraceae bacterium]|nr:hypothetical protein [Ktedonobacteraceae bacterium]
MLRRNARIFRCLPCFMLLIVLLAACAPNSGILSGGNWVSGGLAHQHIRALAVDANNPQNIYAGDEQGTVFVSADGGEHWTQYSSGLPASDPIHALSLDIPGKKLFAATGKGLFVSTDRARHWSVVPHLPPGSFTALAFDVEEPSLIFAGTATHGVFISNNDGASWRAVSNGLPSSAVINSLVVDPGHHQLWAATSAGVYRASDKAALWQPFNTGLPAGIVVNTVQPTAPSGGAQNLVYAGTNRGFFLSQDLGAHWSRGKENLSGTSVYCILIDFRSANATTVYIGTDVGAFRSDDSGQTWGAIATGLPKNQPVYALELGAQNYAQLFAAANDIYLYPGSGGGFDGTRILTIIIIVAFFFLLYYVTRRNQLKRAGPRRPQQPPAGAPQSEPTPPSQPKKP